MKRISIGIGLVVSAAMFLQALVPAAVQAHVLESDGDIAAVLHIPPDDTPRAEQATTISLAFASGQANFDINDYAIQVIVKKGDKQVTSGDLVADSGSSHDGSASVTFPEAGAYQLLVDGKPLHSQRAFQLKFSVRADVPPGTVTTGTQFGSVSIDFWVLNAGILAIFVLVAQYAIRSGGRYAVVAIPEDAKGNRRKTPVQH